MVRKTSATSVGNAGLAVSVKARFPWIPESAIKKASRQQIRDILDKARLIEDQAPYLESHEKQGAIHVEFEDMQHYIAMTPGPQFRHFREYSERLSQKGAASAEKAKSVMRLYEMALFPKNAGERERALRLLEQFGKEGVPVTSGGYRMFAFRKEAARLLAELKERIRTQEEESRSGRG